MNYKFTGVINLHYKAGLQWKRGPDLKQQEQCTGDFTQLVWIMSAEFETWGEKYSSDSVASEINNIRSHQHVMLVFTAFRNNRVDWNKLSMYS